jgi:hypothetical protein
MKALMGYRLLLVAGTTGEKLPVVAAVLPDHVRANDRFKDVCGRRWRTPSLASGVDGGAMGIHYVNAKYLKDEVPDIAPIMVMYEPMPTARWRWSPSNTSSGTGRAKGQLFNFNGSQSLRLIHYELHVWALRPIRVARLPT